MKNKQRGFTLIEVMVALMIAVVSIVGLMKATSQSAHNTIYFKDKTLASIVASNLAVEVRLSEKPKPGYIDKKYQMAGKDWPYRIHTTTRESFFGVLLKSEILVYASIAEKNNKQHLAQVEVYLEAPQLAQTDEETEDETQ